MKTAAIELNISGHNVKRTAAISTGSELGGVGMLSFAISDADHLSPFFTNQVVLRIWVRCCHVVRKGE